MPGFTSATGLLEARTRPICRSKPKHVELSGSTKPAPFILRPFSSLFNPYPYGCSVLCNHPADCEAKEVLKRAKDSWATEGKSLLLSEETDMIRANLVARGSIVGVKRNIGIEVTNDAATVPEELFRKYTETDSRPVTPTPTLVSGITMTNRLTQEEFPINCNPRERATLVLDLRTNAKKQMENETFTWHALALEPAPTHRKTEIFVSKPISRRISEHQIRSPKIPTNFPDPVPDIDIYDESNSGRNTDENKVNKSNKELTIIRRRGKRLRKGKCRRGSAYGQQTEICDLLESTETQISHIGNKSTNTLIHANENAENLVATPNKTPVTSNVPSTMLSSFIDTDILKHLFRELDMDKVEAEFFIRRKIALNEALRVKGESYSHSRRLPKFSNPVFADTPRVFSRQAVRFEILSSESLYGLTVLDYLSKHVYVSSGRKLIFGKIFNKYQEGVIEGSRYISVNDIHEALEDVIGKPITHEQEVYLKSMIGEIKKPLNFRTWCGLCAAVERLLCFLSPKEADPATWLEKVDFETLERRLKSPNIDSKLAQFLREIRDK